MRVEMAEMLDGIQRSPAEYAWIKACKRREAARGRVPRPEIGQLEHLTITAIDRCVFMGWMTAEQFAVLATHGAIGPPNRTDFAARQLWDAGIAVLEAEMNRMVFPPPSPPARPRDLATISSGVREEHRSSTPPTLGGGRWIASTRERKIGARIQACVSAGPATRMTS